MQLTIGAIITKATPNVPTTLTVPPNAFSPKLSFIDSANAHSSTIANTPAIALSGLTILSFNVSQRLLYIALGLKSVSVVTLPLSIPKSPNISFVKIAPLLVLKIIFPMIDKQSVIT